jgi:hypothetical protein
MRGRIGIAAVGLVALTLPCAVSPGAGAQSTPWSVRPDGGFVPPDLLDTFQLALGGARAVADAASVATVTLPPIFLIACMCPAGLLLVGRRRIVAFARSFGSSNPRRVGS